MACQRALDTAKVLQGNIERLSQGEQWVHHELAPAPTAEAAAEPAVGTTPGIEAEAKAGVAAGLIARVFLRVTRGVGNQGPLADFHLGRE